MSLPSDESWCSRRTALQIARQCWQLQDRDMLALLQRMRGLGLVPMHGPEHHGLVAAIVLTAYRNAGGELAEQAVTETVLRANSIPGGSCGKLGICGAAVGLGTALATLLYSSPLDGQKRALVQQAVCQATESIASLNAPRCCQRECALTLRVAAELSEKILPVRLTAKQSYDCVQFELCDECVGQRCLLHPEHHG